MQQISAYVLYGLSPHDSSSFWSPNCISCQLGKVHHRHSTTGDLRQMPVPLLYGPQGQYVGVTSWRCNRSDSASARADATFCSASTRIRIRSRSALRLACSALTLASIADVKESEKAKLTMANSCSIRPWHAIFSRKRAAICSRTWVRLVISFSGVNWAVTALNA